MMKNLAKQQTVLVTGGTGFVGNYCVLQLLQQGHTVKTTLWSLNRKDEVECLLEKAGAPNTGNLSFVVADLTKHAVSECTYVLHVASPFSA